MLKRSLILLTLMAVFSPQTAHAQKIKNQIAVFAALDKVTAQISPLEIPIDKTGKFGPLSITPRTCNTRPPTEQPLSAAFVEIDETQLDDTRKRIFTGWMFAESPGLHGVEHPVFDVWLTSCKTAEGAKPKGNSWKPQ
jgi:hypothetical protein